MNILNLVKGKVKDFTSKSDGLEEIIKNMNKKQLKDSANKGIQQIDYLFAETGDSIDKISYKLKRNRKADELDKHADLRENADSFYNALFLEMVDIQMEETQKYKILYETTKNELDKELKTVQTEKESLKQQKLEFQQKIQILNEKLKFVEQKDK